MSVELTIETVEETIVLELQDHVPAVLTIDHIPELRDELDSKVDKELGYSLIPDTEITRLATMETGATKNRSDSENADKVHEHVIADVTGLDAALLAKFDKADIAQATGTATDKVMSQKAVTDALGNKVDKEAGKSLVSDTEIEKLSTVEQYATANRPDAQNADKEHTHVISDVTGLDTALETKVDKVEGYSLVADDEIGKLSTVEQYAQKNTVSSVAGKQGDVLLDKSDVGLSAVDNTADADKPVSTAIADALADKVDKVEGKQLSDENYTLDEKDKLGGIAEQATKNRDDSENADKLHTHTISDVTGLTTRLNDIDALVSAGDVALRQDLASPDKGAAMVGFLQGGVNAVGRDLLDKNRERISVRDFGQLGVGNDAAVFQKAADYVASLRVAENVGGGLYGQEASAPILDATGLVLVFEVAVTMPHEFIWDLKGTSIDGSAVSGYLFKAPRPGGVYKALVLGGVYKHCENVYEVFNSSPAGAYFSLGNARFDDISGEVFTLNAQSTKVTVYDCDFLFVKRVVTNIACDFALFTDCQLVPLHFDGSEQVVIENYGKLELRRILAMPRANTGGYINTAWCSNRYSPSLVSSGGRSGVLISRDCRWGGENGGITFCNNYAPAISPNGTQVILSGGDAISNSDGGVFATTGTRRCIVRLFDVPSLLDVQSAAGAASPLIDRATVAELVPAGKPRIFTANNQGLGLGGSSFTGTDIPPELISFANLDRVYYNITSNVDVNHSVARGGVVTNNGTASGVNIFTIMPFARQGMQITYSNTQVGSGFMQLQTKPSEVMKGGITTGSFQYTRLNAGESITFICGQNGVWQPTQPILLKGSEPYDPPSLAEGAGVTKVIAVDGASVGDFVDVTFSQPIQGVTLTAWIHSASSVSIRLHNLTGSTVDLPSGTLTAIVRKI